MNDDIKASIREFLVETFLFGEPFTLGDDDSLLDNGVVDSGGVLSLVVFLEERFGITVADDEVEASNLDSLARLTRFVVEKQKAS
jgi:acyl carrier protein